RAVPLHHYYFYQDYLGVERAIEFQNELDIEVEDNSGEANHQSLIKHLVPSYLPCLFFVFSRRRCAEKANETAKNMRLLNKEELVAVDLVISKYRDISNLPKSSDFKLLSQVLRRGIGYHHAGLLPVLKDMVEELFSMKLIKVLFCTETFSVGINYPVRSVCFDGQRKYNGKSIRPLKAQEYFQMSGRAGRRGMDEAGFAFTLLSDRYSALTNYSFVELERLNSQFRLSYNSILNLIRFSHDENMSKILNQSFASYLADEARHLLEQKVQKLTLATQDYERDICPLISTTDCPVTFGAKMGTLKTYESILRRGHYKNRDLRKKREILLAEIKKANRKNCSTEIKSKCRQLSIGYQQTVSQMAENQLAIASLPPGNTFSEQFHKKVGLLKRIDYATDTKLLARGEV
ncbi:MAG: helicase-related protein, partial [bacterium]|nr:helicase-related protein [bacterium]